MYTTLVTKRVIEQNNDLNWSMYQSAILACVARFWQQGEENRATGVVSVRSGQKLPPCPTDPMPDNFKTNPPLAKLSSSTTALE